MLIEQAFLQLPEVLVGSGYPTQDYESGIVAAMSLSLLQQLNGRNVQNPLSLIQLEKPFRARRGHWLAEDGKKRYLRADLHLNSYEIAVGNPRLSAYGWRHSNWMEAKFFRSYDSKGKPKKSSNQPLHTADLLADLLRILILVRREVAKKDEKIYTGRYLLHVYLRRLSDHLCVERNIPIGEQVPDGPKRRMRPWLAGITTPGIQPKVEFRIGDETKTIRDKLNSNLNDVVIEFVAENYVVQPTEVDGDIPIYVCHLTRINSFKISLGADSWGVTPNREEIESSDGAYSRIRDHVGKYINIKGAVEELEPSEDESDGDINDKSDDDNPSNL